MRDSQGTKKGSLYICFATFSSIHILVTQRMSKEIGNYGRRQAVVVRGKIMTTFENLLLIDVTE